MDEKRTVCGLEVKFAMHVGDREVLMLLDQKSEDMPYIVGYCTTIPDFGLEQMSETVGGNDYLEAVEEFLNRAQGQVESVRSSRALSDEPQEVLGPEHCLPDGMKHSLQGAVVVIKPDVLRPEYRNAANQLVLVGFGFGASPNARGQAIFGNTVFTGEKSNWRRHEVLGVLDPSKAPDFVKPGVEAIRAQQKAKGGKEHGR